MYSNNNNQKMGSYKSDSYTHYTKQQQIMSFYRGIRFLSTTPIGIIISFIFAIATIVAVYFDTMYILISFFLLIFVPYCIGQPLQSHILSLKFAGAGIKNVLGEPPILKNQKKLKNGDIIYSMQNNGIAIDTYYDYMDAVSSALNRYVYCVEYGKNNNIINVYSKPLTAVLPDFIAWEDKFLSDSDNVMYLGESMFGQYFVSMQITPHFLIAGSTGSGKSMLIKLLLWQMYLLDYTIYIADFKHIEFGKIWHKIGDVINDIDTLELKLNDVMSEINRRKDKFDLYCDVNNIEKYIKISGKKMNRIVVCIDEVAELTDRIGTTKVEKEKIDKIVAMISSLARIGRAYGVHLILSTQRSEVSVIRGQIRDNCDIKICGRADTTLSTMILGDGRANTKIPKNAQGRFVDNTHDGRVFQGYFFDENVLKNL